MLLSLKLSRKKEGFFMKRSRFVAVMVVCVMVMGVIQPAFAFSGGKVVKDTAEYLLKAENINDSARGMRDGLVKTAAKETIKHAADTAIVGSATSTAVTVAGYAGVTAKTGTAIATLSGAAATNATLCAIGTPVVTTLGIAAAPAVVGGVIVGAAAAGVCYGVHCLIDWIW